MSSGRYLVEEGSPGGGRIMADFKDPIEALHDRDRRRDQQGRARRCFRVIDSDAVDGAPDAMLSGEVEWCGLCDQGVTVNGGPCSDCEGEPG